MLFGMSTPPTSFALPALARLLARAAAREWLSEQETPTVKSPPASVSLEERLTSDLANLTHEQKTTNHG
jgi:hypothetical protein